MRIRSLCLKNFRGAATGEVLFSDDSVLIGTNSVGKSTVCEALDLLLGPDRLRRTSAIDEHDFFERRYLGDDGTPIPIELETVLTDLTPDLARRYKGNIEHWDTRTLELLDENAGPEAVDGETVVPALRIAFHGIYDQEEDEFTAETYFASPPSEDGERRPKLNRSDKRSLGFIYLRALRTGTRALSLERGSLLDIILRLKDEERSAMWEQTLQSLERLDPPIHEIRQLGDVLDEIEKRVRRFVGLSQGEQSLRLFPSALTRESLRRSVTLFGASELSETSVPYWRLGSGVINAMVFALLTFIAEHKQNVIFAMEEPEIAIPPHTQRRIVQFLRDSMDQSILTTHSPFVLEQFRPESVVLLRRLGDNRLTGTPLKMAGIRAKTYRGGLRRQLAEAMLGRGVVCVEGVSDGEVLDAASAVMEAKAADDVDYTPLDLSGVTLVQCDGDGGLARHGEFFNELGLRTYAFFDKHRDPESVKNITSTFYRSWELEEKGLERVLANDTPIGTLRRFLDAVSRRDDYPRGSGYLIDPAATDQDVRDTCFRVLRARKGAGYARALIECCRSASELPDVIVQALGQISADLPSQLATLEGALGKPPPVDDDQP